MLHFTRCWEPVLQDFEENLCKLNYKNLPINQCEQKHIMSTNSVTTKPIPALPTHLQFAFIT